VNTKRGAEAASTAWAGGGTTPAGVKS
jgi:hypothetical protein